jgi:pyruvate/2-oxoglutarate/acetoin dehydrogenase E1 component
VKKTGRLLIVEEDNLTNGWGAEIAALIADEAFAYLDAPIKRLAAPDVPPPFAPALEQAYVPSEQRIIATALAMC